MSHLALIRCVATAECWDYYETKTDIWCFGDAMGYKYLRQKIGNALHARENTHLELLERHSTSMRAVILPPLKRPRSKPQLKFIERFISPNGSENMELIIFGNSAGYEYLRRQVARLLANSLGDPSDHVHLDDWMDKKIVPRSVSINLRGPVRCWSRKDLQEYSDMIFSKRDHFLPAGLSCRDRLQPYEEIGVKTSAYVRL